MTIPPVITVLLVAASCGDQATPPSFHDRLVALDATPCDATLDATFLCGTIEVPADHDRLDGPTQPFAFAGRAALGPSTGVLLSIAGGPGFSGIDEIDDWTTTDPSIPQTYDLLTFDLRGVERSTSLDCPDASSAWYTGGLRGATSLEQQVLVARAQLYASECPAEAGVDAAQLSVYTTAQAAGDIEALRIALAIDSFAIYGLSYGTQLAQTYATAHPERVRSVVLDGVIDLTRTEPEFATSLQDAVAGILDRTLAACASDPACVADLGSDAGASYDAISAALVAGPKAIGARTFTRGDLDTVSVLAVDDAAGRTALLQALGAAHARADFAPLRALLDDLNAIDPVTETVGTGGFSDAVYYTFTANDYGRPPSGTTDYVAGAAAILAGNPRTIDAYFGDLPTSIWPGAPASLTRPGPFAPGAPVLVIDADADAATPVVQGRAVLAAARAAGNPIREIAVSGGHHVMAADNACVDAEIAAFLADADMDAARTDTACTAPFVLPYGSTFHRPRSESRFTRHRGAPGSDRKAGRAEHRVP